ncbi:unnamed protein product [Brassicogethes aeneus]|uniref:Uncharacterized protein n=1 Tax=Brassicogethes aeneus TaxID=1431903 RepID=A0A9P0F9Z9_BRAAE|nr:unnamed protein product [Brassicogethes aeneus]
MNLRSEGQEAAAQVIEGFLDSLRNKPVGRGNIIPYTLKEALALIIDHGLSKDAYLKLRKGAKERNANIYPSYDKVKEAKKECYPQERTFNEASADVKLQSLLDHTTNRIVKLQSPVLHTIQNMSDLELISKWGFDGSSNHPSYKQ